MFAHAFSSIFQPFINIKTFRSTSEINQLICYVYKKKIVANKRLRERNGKKRVLSAPWLKFNLLNRKRWHFWQRKLWLIIHLSTFNHSLFCLSVGTGFLVKLKGSTENCDGNHSKNFRFWIEPNEMIHEEDGVESDSKTQSIKWGILSMWTGFQRVLRTIFAMNHLPMTTTMLMPMTITLIN